MSARISTRVTDVEENTVFMSQLINIVFDILSVPDFMNERLRNSF